MIPNQRKSARQPLTYGGNIAALDGAAICECRIMNISSGGARLLVQHPAKVPDEFTLVLARKANRHCIVVWREDHEVGVRFI